MTKVINIPISSESCRKIGIGIALTLWILATVGMIYVFTGLWFDWWDNNNGDRILFGMFSFFGTSVSLIGMMIYFHDKGVWVTFKCNCGSKRKKK